MLVVIRRVKWDKWKVEQEWSFDNVALRKGIQGQYTKSSWGYFLLFREERSGQGPWASQKAELLGPGSPGCGPVSNEGAGEVCSLYNVAALCQHPELSLGKVSK